MSAEKFTEYPYPRMFFDKNPYPRIFTLIIYIFGYLLRTRVSVIYVSKDGARHYLGTRCVNGTKFKEMVTDWKSCHAASFNGGMLPPALGGTMSYRQK